MELVTLKKIKKNLFLDKTPNLLTFGSTDCETNLQIKGIKIHDNGKSYKITNSAAQLRQNAEHILNSKNFR